MLSGDELWMAGVAGRCKVWATRAYPALKGREKEIAEIVRREFEATLARRLGGGGGDGGGPAPAPDLADADADADAPSAPPDPASRLAELARSSPRARAQLRQACLAAATQRVFSRELGGGPEAEREAARAVAEAMGGLHAPFFLAALQTTAWLRRVLLRQPAFDQACQTLDRLGRDLSGAATVGRLPPARGAGRGGSDGGGGGGGTDDKAGASDDGKTAAAGGQGGGGQHHATLEVSACGVADLLRAEGVADLLAPSFCCGHAATWFDAYATQGVGASLDGSLMWPDGGGCCRLRVYSG